MLLSISLILIVGMFMGWLCQKCRLPSLLGMLVLAVVVGVLAAVWPAVRASRLRVLDAVSYE